MNENDQFQHYYEFTLKLYRTMVYGLFIYPLFVAGAESFHWAVFHFLNFETMKTMGLIFMILSIAFFPLSYIADTLFTKGCTNVSLMGRKMMYAEIAKMAMSELITFFGLAIYITSANLKFFYLFFLISFIHLLLIRPQQKLWQKRLDSISE